MAFKRAFSEVDFTCSVCRDIFRDPVLLSCGHSVCRACVRQYWATKGTQECPLCRRRSFKTPPTNRALNRLSESFLLARGDPETRCELHDEELKLYCVEESQLACVVCRESLTHLNHKFRPVDEIAVELKDVVKSALKTTTVKIKSLQNAQLMCEVKIVHIQEQAQHVRNRIKEEFIKLHDFLGRERKCMMATLKAEKQQKTHMVKARIEQISKDIQTLSNTVKETNEKLHTQSIPFVKNFENILKEAQGTPDPDPKVPFGEVIDVAKYLGNLQYNVWKKMQDIVTYTPVVLDPNTAHSELILSQDLTSMRDSDEETRSQQVLDIPEQFKSSACVLGSSAFSSGKHSWDVEVNNNTFWMVGLTTESVRRKEQSVFPSAAWGVGYDNERLCARSPDDACYPLPVAAKLQVV